MYYIGIDIGGMSIKGGLVNDAGTILYKKSIKTDIEKDGNGIAFDIVQLIKDIILENNLRDSDIKGIGLGSSGSIYDEKGIIRYSCNIPFIKTPIVKIIKQNISVDNVKISNDANCAALGETMFGAARGYKSTILVTLGTGVGTGFIVDGKLITGNKSAGAEGGHIQLNLGGAVCGCNKKGHYEAYASATALMNQIKAACLKAPDSILNDYLVKDGLDGSIAFKAMHDGCPVAKKVVKKYINYVALGLVSLANIFFPEVIIIGGGVSNAGDDLVIPLQKYISKNIYGAKYSPKIKVVAATLKNDAGIIGAACLTM